MNENENEHNKILKEYQDWELGRIALIESMMIHYLGWREVMEKRESKEDE